MKLIKPFRGLRPPPKLAARVACAPYDVLSREEACPIARNNPCSFLHINKPEVDLDVSIDAHDPQVYARGRANLERFIKQGMLQRDDAEKLYVYRQIMGEHSQTGLVAAASVAAYEQGLIKKHEFTRPDKEQDRVAHMDALAAQVGPVFLTYQASPAIDELIGSVTVQQAEYDFVADDGTRHSFWVVQDGSTSAMLSDQVNALDCLYIADGHHRSAAAARVKALYHQRNRALGDAASCNWFLSVLFPHDQVQILDYNRVIKDLDGLSRHDFLAALRSNFELAPVADCMAAKPCQSGQFGLYLGGGNGEPGQWYGLQTRADLLNRLDANDPVQRLDVSILQQTILDPLLGIKDQRIDRRIDFVGGIRGLEALQQRVDSGDWHAAIALYPTSIESLMAIADADAVMPPKSTWFEPKLKSGLVVHMLD